MRSPLPRDYGDYVKYDDHLAAMQAKDARIAALEVEVVMLKNRYNPRGIAHPAKPCLSCLGRGHLEVSDDPADLRAPHVVKCAKCDGTGCQLERQIP